MQKKCLINNQKMKSELGKYLNEIANSNVTYSRAGGGAGCVILIKFEKQNLIYSMFINCAWRIEMGDKVITTSADDTTAKTGPMAKGVRLLEGLKVLSVNMSKFYDLSIKFENNISLNVFCDITPTNILLSSQNWDLSVIKEDLSFEISPNFEIKRGKYYS